MTKETKKHRKDFLLTFFDEREANQHKFMNGFVLFKHFNGDNKNWQVDIFTEESWYKMNNSHLF